MTRDLIVASIKKAVGDKAVSVESPENSAFGDYSTNVALGAKDSRQAAERLVEKLKKDKKLSSVVGKIEVAGPGFINFWLSKEFLLQNLKEVDNKREKYGNSSVGKGKTMVIDYSSPNIAKPFGIGHLRSTIVGQAIYNLYKALGYRTVGDNHLGDWGTQFGKLLYMIKKEKLKDFDLAKLEELYTEFHKLAENPALGEKMEEDARLWFKRLEEDDPEARSIWKKCVAVSMAEFDRIYDMLGVKIDYTYGESAYEDEMRGMMADPAIKKHLSNGKDGAKVIDLDKEGIKVPLMFLKKDGATTYATRDLATLRFRTREWDPDIIIYEVGAEQTLYFQQIFAAARILGLVKGKVLLIHTAHGLYLAPDGKKFSTRHGKTIKLEEVLDEAIQRAAKLGNSSEELAQQVGIGAIKYFDLMHTVSSSVVFDWEKMMNLEGNSGPYLQYTVARCNSVLSKGGFKGVSIKDFEGMFSSSNKATPGILRGVSLKGYESVLLRDLVKFAELIEDSANNCAPNLLCNYLYQLAQKYNSFYNSNRIIGSDTESYRLATTFGVAQVLKNGLKILGIETPEKM